MSKDAILDAGVHVGAPVIFSAPTRRVGELLVGPAMDNRVGLALMDAADRRPTASPASCG